MTLPVSCGSRPQRLFAFRSGTHHLSGRRLACRARVRTIAVTDPALSEGFHAFEPDNGPRWTDGDAALPASLFGLLDGPNDLVLQVGATASYPLLVGPPSPTAA